VPPLGHVFLGDDIETFKQARLADAELRRDVDHEAVLEAGQPGAHMLDQRGDALAASKSARVRSST